MGKSGREKASSQDMVHKVSKENLSSFKTPDKRSTKTSSFKTIDKNGTKTGSFKTPGDRGTKTVHFKTLDEQIKATKADNSISFKTFSDWVKARTVKCDMKLKECTSFVSDNKSMLDGEKDQLGARDASPMRSNPSHTEPSSQQPKSISEPQTCRETPKDRGESHMKHSRGEISQTRSDRIRLDQTRSDVQTAQQRRDHPDQIRVDQTGSNQIRHTHHTEERSPRLDQTGSDQIKLDQNRLDVQTGSDVQSR